MDRIQKLERIQNEAVDEWIKNDYCGVLLLATGVGKTFCAIKAALEAINNGVIQKNAPLFFYAETEVREKTMWEEIDKFKQIYGKDLRDYYNIIFRCYQSLESPTPGSFVVLDEVHDCMSPTRYHLFHYKTQPQMQGIPIMGKRIARCMIGLSATIPDLNVFAQELGDAANQGLKQTDSQLQKRMVTQFITKRQMVVYFGGIVYKYSQRQGIEDGILSPFETILVDHQLDDSKYNIKDGGKTKQWMTTERKWYSGKIKWIASVKNNFMKRKIAAMFAPFLYTLPSKIPVVKGIIKRHQKDKIVVFGTRIEALQEMLDHVVTGDKSTAEFIDWFNNDHIKVIGSAFKLRQGITLDGVNVCILHSYFSRQHIFEQIIGRVIRFSPNKVAKVYIIRTQNTMEANKWYPSILKKDDGTNFEINVIDIKSSNYYL